jgi:hypothetical protein
MRAAIPRAEPDAASGAGEIERGSQPEQAGLLITNRSSEIASWFGPLQGFVVDG